MGLRSSFFEPFHIPSGSMIPNLFIGDFVLVNKFSYGFKLPFTDYLKSPVYMTEFTPPKRGDIIVFRYPLDTNISFIKRVIGLPSETVVIKNGEVTIINTENPNGLQLDQSYVEYKSETDNMTVSLAGDEYFVMGDNRKESYDSRMWGPLS